jgi:predicted lipoprotein with Yx(FWY)xxD motif/plastocyanin
MKPWVFSLNKLLMVFSIISIMVVLVACSSTPSPSTTAPTTIVKSLPPTTTSSTPPATTSAPPPVTTTTAPASSTAAAYTVNIASDPKLGSYLVDAKGMTLYYFTQDTINNSTAVGANLTAWPLFNPASFVVPSSLNASDFGTTTRPDGLKTATYKGWPLYYFVKDAAPGDIKGEGLGGVWFVIKIPFYNVMLQTKTGIGNYLVDPKGMTLYYFTKDSVGNSTPTGAILANWPVFNAPNFVTISKMNPTDFSTLTRADGLKVTTFKGFPLYYFIKDQVSGDTQGQGVGGIWFTVDPANFPPSATPSPSPSPSPTAGAGQSVNIQSFAFTPPSLPVPVGTKVTWTNNDSVAHTVTSDSGAFNGSLAPGATFSFTFTQAGTFSYHCAIHPSMTAKIVVQ